jgi:hypothetical protein
MKIETTKVGGAVSVPNINAENMGDSSAWTKAVSAETETKGQNGLVALRSYFLLASVADMKIAKAKEIVDSSGADKGLLSKGGKVARHYLALVLDGRDLDQSPVTANDYAEGLEMCVAEHGSLYGAYTAIMGEQEPKEQTLETMVANLYKWADKNGIGANDVILEVLRQGEGK